MGETLTADGSGIADGDGLYWAMFDYQWLSGRETEIDGATSPIYTLQASDVGNVIKVRVTFTDDAGYEESLTSEATSAVRQNVSATGAPTITGTPEVGETLTGDTSGIVDSDGPDNVSFSYQWIRSDGRTASDYPGAPFTSVPTDGSSADLDIDGATSATYTVTAADVDKTIKLRVDFTDDKGSVESLTSSATAVVPVEAAFTFSIDGTTVSCDSYNVHIVNLPKEECDDPSSIDQGESGEIEVEIEIKRSVSSQLYKFRFHIYQVEDSIGHYTTVEANDLCLGPGLADSVSMEVTSDDGTGNFTYTDEGTIFDLCPAGTYQLYVPWYRYNYDDQEYEYAGTFRRYFFINGDDEEATSIEQVKFITALYPDTPVSHDEVKIQGTKQSTMLNRELTTFSLSIDGLVPDSDAETTDYVVRVRVIGDDGPYKVVPWCHVGNVGYSYLLKTVPEDGRWAMDAHVLGNCLRGRWPDTLQVELFDGSDLTDYSEPIVFHGSHIISNTGGLKYPEYGTHEFIAGRDISLGALSNSPATGAPTISGTAEVGETLTADTSGIADTDGLDNVSFSYQWLSSRDAAIPGATSSTYSLTSTDAGKIIKVKVTFADDEGNEESLTSSPTAAVADSSNNPATGVLTIIGAAQVGQTLTASTSGIVDDDGLTNPSYAYQWITNNGTSDSDIQDATSSTYTLVSHDVGKTIKVKVSFTDDGGNEETLTSAATIVVEVPLTAELQSVPDSHNGSGTFTFRILFSEPVTVGFAALKEHSFQVTNATIKRAQRVDGRDDLRKFTVQPSSDAAVVLVLPITEDCSDEGAICTSDGKRLSTRLELTVPGPAPANTAATGAPTIGGTLEAGQILTASTSGIGDANGVDNVSFSYQWIANDGTADADIQDATAATYALADADVGKTIKVRVSFIDDGGNDETLTSEATAAVEARPNSPATGAPTISGAAQVGETLTADTSDISDSDGLDGVSFSYQWLADDVAISGATGSTYTLSDAEEGNAIRVRVSFTDDRGNEETLARRPRRRWRRLTVPTASAPAPTAGR